MKSSLSSHLRDLAITAGIMVALAGLLTLLMPHQSFAASLRYSLAIGLAIHLVSALLCGLDVNRLTWRISLVAIPAGTGMGMLLAGFLNGSLPQDLVADHPDTLAAMLAVSLVFGTGVSYYFHSRAALAEYARQAADARLRLLQAQMEPHFLFNTLATVLSLIHDDPDRAEAMLEDFIAYLRASLERTRAERVTLAEEVALARAYLDIQSRRLGPRLSYHLDIAPELQGVLLPPLLLQPLVENAVKHGLEPRAEGGWVDVQVRRELDRLVMMVRDTGAGPGQGKGIGLGHIRARLTALYGPRAEVRLEPAPTGGTVATLRLPVEEAAAP